MAQVSDSRQSEASVKYTNRKDWDLVVKELFAKVVDGVPFGIGVVSKEKTLLGYSVRYRMNNGFTNKSVQNYIRKNLNAARMDKLFSNDQGLGKGAAGGVFRVEGENLGLPKNSLVARVEQQENSSHRAVIIFGGERLEGKLEMRLEKLAEILTGTTRTAQRSAMLSQSEEDLYATLQKLNVKRLFDYDLKLLSNIVNTLEDQKESLPKDLKPKFKVVSDFVLKRSVKKRPY